MELKKYKRINNQQLPGHAKGLDKFDASKADWGGVGVNAIQFGGSLYNSFQGPKSTNDIVAESGKSLKSKV